MTVADVLDGAFGILKTAPATILGFTAIFAVPVNLLAAWLQRDIFSEGILDIIDDPDTSLTAIEEGSGGPDVWGQMIILFGPALALVFIAAGLVRLVGAWQTGGDLTIGELLRGSLRQSWALLASWVIVHIGEGVGMLLLAFPGLIVMTLCLVTAPVIGAENLGPIAAIRRSARLTRRRFWPVMGLAILSGLVATLFSYALGSVPAVLSALFGTDGWGWLLTAASGIIGGLVTLPVVAGATVLIYLDLRVRTEGLDLELEAREVLAA